MHECVPEPSPAELVRLKGGCTAKRHPEAAPAPGPPHAAKVIDSELRLAERGLVLLEIERRQQSAQRHGRAAVPVSARRRGALVNLAVY